MLKKGRVAEVQCTPYLWAQCLKGTARMLEIVAGSLTYCKNMEACCHIKKDFGGMSEKPPSDTGSPRMGRVMPHGFNLSAMRYTSASWAQIAFGGPQLGKVAT